MSKFTSLVLCAVAVSISCVCAKLSDEERAAIREAVSPIIDECSVGHDDDLGSCFIGCLFNKLAVVDENGVYNLNVTLTVLKTYIKSLNHGSQFEETARKCVRVNEKPVSAGNEICERAQMIMSCALEHKPPSTQYAVIADAVLE